MSSMCLNEDGPQDESLIETSTASKVKRIKKRKEKNEFLVIPENHEIEFNNETARSLLTTSRMKRRLDGKKMKEQLAEAEEKNEHLAKAIEEKNGEIAQLKKSIDGLNDVLNSVPIEELRCNSSIASSKLMDLSKKNRTLQSQLEQAKSRLCKKDCDIQKLERELKNYEAQIEDLKNPKTKSASDELQAKISSLQQKVFESRNKNVELQNQLKIAQKLLTQEIGENFNVSNWTTLHSMQPSWRGRAQQILQLHQKEKELREKLEQYEQQFSGFPPTGGVGDVFNVAATTPKTKRSEGGGGAINSPKSHLTLPHLVATQSYERFNTEPRRTQAQQRAKVEALEKEIALLKENLEQANSKLLALKVRNKTLSDELNKCRTNYSTQQQMEEYNSIMHSSSLMDKLNKQKMQYEAHINELRQSFERASREREEALYREQTAQTKYDEAQDILANKDEIIEELNEALKKAESDLKAVTDGFLFSCRDLKKEEFIGVLDALEKEKTELVKLNKTLNERLLNERTKNENLSDSLSKAKIKISRLEAKIRELEKEIEVLTDKKKRAQRIADYASSVTSLQSCRSVPSFSFENSNSQAPSATLTARNETNFESNYNDIKDQLEYANEKIVLLTEKINYLTKEKESDSKTFENTIGNTKATLLETILEHKCNIPRPMSAIPSGKRVEPITVSDATDLENF